MPKPTDINEAKAQLKAALSIIETKRKDVEELNQHIQELAKEQAKHKDFKEMEGRRRYPGADNSAIQPLLDFIKAEYGVEETNLLIRIDKNGMSIRTLAEEII